MKRLLSIALIATAVFSAPLWTAKLLEYPAVEAFALSDRLWFVVAGFCLAIAAIGLGFALSAAVTPQPLRVAPGSEGHE